MIVAGSESFDPKLSSATLDGLKVIDLAQIDPKLSSATLNCLEVINLAQVVGALVSIVCQEHWRTDFVTVTKLQFLMLFSPSRSITVLSDLYHPLLPQPLKVYNNYLHYKLFWKMMS